MKLLITKLKQMKEKIETFMKALAEFAKDAAYAIHR